MKIKVVKKWSRDYDSEVEPMARKLDRLRFVLSNDLPKAVALLAGITKTLDSYTQISSDLPDSGPSAPKPETETEEGGEA